MFEQRDPSSALPSNSRTHKPCRARAQNNHIELARR
jgi:hypothetical protein